MRRFTNNTINSDLTILRNSLRSGEVRVADPEAFKRAVGVVLAGLLTPVKFNTETFKPSVLVRFNRLFEVPNRGDETTGDVWPTQNEYATALQHFINRRQDVWVHVKLPPLDNADMSRPTGEATETTLG
jgi:hypothetical protein